MIHMSHFPAAPNGHVSVGPQPTLDKRPAGLHRLQEVRRREQVSRRSVARHLGVPESEVRAQESGASDVSLSVLYRWAALLGVPVAELLVEPPDTLSPPIQLRARLVRVMKTARVLLEQASHAPTRRLAETLIGQLTEIMPELENVKAWHTDSRHRRRDDYGATYLRRLPQSVFLSDMEDDL